MKWAFLLIWLMLLSTSVSSQVTSQGPVVPYDTVYLKGGDRLIFETTDLTRQIRYKSETTDTLIRQLNIKSPIINLGRLAGDFDDYVVLVSDNYVQGIFSFHKPDGKQAFRGVSIEVDTLHGLIYYIDREREKQLALFTVKNGRTEYFDPVDAPCHHWYECITARHLGEKELMLEYIGPNNVRMKKVYPRQL